MNIEQELQKLRYQIQIIHEVLDLDKRPVISLILTYGWGYNDHLRLTNMFEKFSEMIDNGQEFDYFEINVEVEKLFDLGHQHTKMIILAHYEEEKWVNVCEKYIKSYHCVEFDGLGLY